MERLWFITNPASGTTSHAKCEALEAVFAERGLTLVGRTNFPEDRLPEPAALDAERVDTVVLFAGDGTINAALCALEQWEGAFLILPGGTMNLLAKGLHSETDPHKILHAAHRCDRRVALPYVRAGANRAFVGLILGPAASWFRAREAVREGRLVRLVRAVRVAWRNTFGDRGIRVRGTPGLGDRYQAILVTPRPDGLSLAGIEARDWKSIVQLGWEWLTGDWIAAQAVREAHTDAFRVRGNRPVLALFDGEPVTLDPRETIKAGRSLETFIATRSDEELPNP